MNQFADIHSRASRLAFPMIVGCARSGTTLLRVMLESGGELAIPGEAPFLADQFRLAQRLSDRGGVSILDIWARFARSRYFDNWSVSPSDLSHSFQADIPIPTADAIRAIYSVYAYNHGRHAYGDKTPGNVLHIAGLSKAFPEARFVHVIRDGRAVAASQLRLNWIPSVSQAAINWAVRVRAGRRQGMALGPARYLEVRYEDLVIDPETSLKEVAQFLCIPFSASMLDYWRAWETFQSTVAFPWAHERLRKPVSDYRDEWMGILSESDISAFELYAGSLLTELGYSILGVTAPQSRPMRNPIVQRFVWEVGHQRRRYIRRTAFGDRRR